MDPALNLILVSVFAGAFALWSRRQSRREAARLDATYGPEPREAETPARN